MFIFRRTKALLGRQQKWEDDVGVTFFRTISSSSPIPNYSTRHLDNS